MEPTSFLTQLLISILPNAVWDVLKKIVQKFRVNRMAFLKPESAPLKTAQPEIQTSDFPKPTRFRIALELMKSRVVASEIAEACGIEYEETAEKYISGETAAPLSFKKKFCSQFNINPNWLIHGKDAPFSHLQNRSFHEAHDAAGFISEFQPDKIYFVKTKSDNAHFCIVLKKDHNYSIIHNNGNWMISNNTGRGGQMQTTSLYVLLKWLKAGCYADLSGGDRQEKRFGISSNFRGIELESEKEFDDLIYGRTYPGTMESHVTRNCTSYWWDDFVDLNHITFSKSDYINKYGEQFVNAQEIVSFILRELGSYKRLVRSC